MKLGLENTDQKFQELRILSKSKIHTVKCGICAPGRIFQISENFCGGGGGGVFGRLVGLICGEGLNTAFYGIFLMAILCGIQKTQQTHARKQ